MRGIMHPTTQIRPPCLQMCLEATLDQGLPPMGTLPAQMTVLMMIFANQTEEALNSLPQIGEPHPQIGVLIHLEGEEGGGGGHNSDQSNESTDCSDADNTSRTPQGVSNLSNTSSRASQSSKKTPRYSLPCLPRFHIRVGNGMEISPYCPTG